MKITAGEIAALVGGKLQGPAGTVITGAMSLPAAGGSDLSFLDKAANAAWTANRPAGCIIAPAEARPELSKRDGAVIYVKNSKQAFTKLTRNRGDLTSLKIFLVQILVATVILLAVFNRDVPRLLPLLIFPECFLHKQDAGRY